MLSIIKEKVLKNEFNRNVLILSGGTLVAQIINVAVSPILTRIYKPESFGLFSLYFSLLSFVSLITTLRYELSITLPKKKEYAFNILIFCLFLSLFFGFIFFIIAFIYDKENLNFFTKFNPKDLLYYVALNTAVVGIYNSLNYWNNREKNYRVIANSKIIQSLTTALIGVGLGFLGLHDNGLILATISGWMIATILLALKFLKYDVNLFKSINRKKIFVLVKKYKKMPIFNLPNALFDGIRVLGINILISKYYTSDALGQYFLALRILQLPTSIIGFSLSQVLLQKIATANKNIISDIIIKFVFNILFIITPIFIFIYFFADNIFPFVFGEEWKLAGEITSILTSWVLVNFLSSPISNVFIVLNKQEFMLTFSIFYTLLPILILYFFHSLEFVSILKIMSLSMTLMLIIFIILAILVAKRSK
jgi:O-antigen/teichoic acid export membrane protein